ncbi:type II secretion system protein GspL [Pseudomonas mangiferae]|uniref:Type II secretion system protein L n=1 Tax=Pseudomonas mangiferae TaxID=2593654 RepID=A0A553H1T7_9PSED|nr:type II secretion system protein GspL [Pseudomonas mangiferae]TRX75703.1 type II secretion system protein GspL [Pseudomonas mangiferae]
MSQAFIFLPPQALVDVDAGCPVTLVEGGGTTTLPFAEAVVQAGPGWRLVLPVEAITACAVQLPTQKARWLRQALPFAVEELLAEDVETMHLALGASLPDGRQRVYAVRRTWLADWLALAGEAGGRPRAIHVDADLLPAEGTHVLWLAERWLLGGELATRMAVQDADWADLAAVCPTPVHGHAAPARQVLAGIDDWQAPAEPFAWLASQVAGAADLAQAEFDLRERDQRWRQWRPLLALVGLWLVLQWGFNLAQAWHLERRGEAYAQASEALYRELFPEDTRLINLRAQFDQHLEAASDAGQGHLLSLMDQAATAVGAGNGRLQVQQLDFSDSRGDLALQVQASGFEDLEQLRERLIAAGLAVQLGSASREAGGVSARLVIGG